MKNPKKEKKENQEKKEKKKNEEENPKMKNPKMKNPKMKNPKMKNHPVFLPVMRKRIFRWTDDMENVSNENGKLIYRFDKKKKFLPSIRNGDIILLFEKQKVSMKGKKNKMLCAFVCDSIQIKENKTICSVVIESNHFKDIPEPTQLPDYLSHLSHSSFGYTFKTTRNDIENIMPFIKK